jgi:hypothetical protein
MNSLIDCVTNRDSGQALSFITLVTLASISQICYYTF